jgi:hypothetical protein
MASTIGDVDIRLLAQRHDAEPIEIGTLTVSSMLSPEGHVQVPAVDFIITSHREAVEVLVAHQRVGDGGGCHCGGVELGQSYPEHVARMLKGPRP